MRINLNPSTSILQHSYRNEDFGPAWLDKLQKDWLTAYDIRYDVSATYRLLWSMEGAKLFCTWLQSEGFKVNFWNFDILYNDSHVAYGIEFVDACPKFVEIKLSVPDNMVV